MLSREAAIDLDFMWLKFMMGKEIIDNKYIIQSEHSLFVTTFYAS